MRMPARIVRLRDVARIELGALQYTSTAFFGEDPTVVLAIYQMPGSNALAPAAARQGQDAGAVEALSQGHRLRHALRHDALRLGVDARRRRHLDPRRWLLVVAVVFIFLQSWRTTIIPTIAIPVSLIATPGR